MNEIWILNYLYLLTYIVCFYYIMHKYDYNDQYLKDA